MTIKITALTILKLVWILFILLFTFVDVRIGFLLGFGGIAGYIIGYADGIREYKRP